MKPIKSTMEDEQTLADKKLAHHKSPPRKSEPDDTEVGDDTPPATTQGYAEKHIVKNPADKPKDK